MKWSYGRTDTLSLCSPDWTDVQRTRICRLDLWPAKQEFFSRTGRSGLFGALSWQTAKNNPIFDYIQQSNDDINTAKTCEYGFSKTIDYEDEVSKWIKKYSLRLTEYLNGDVELIDAIGLKFDKKGNIKVAVPNRIYTLVHSILRPNGELRYRFDYKKLPHWKYIKAHYLGCKPFHMNQGVAASNYKHWMRRAVSEYAFPGKKSFNSSDFQIGMSFDELAKLKKARTKVDKMTQKIWYALRKMIVEDGLR